ncbi:hypothetical protein [Metabacillus endolithicus]|uniref:hypothetical protein n=1 Tax=Metabacillus endolithicus TaxID=1535204 RepID=UPI001FF70F0F|nr:hypothetical protein [Metabacillus endolithicus]UPG65602.1 hypothetical protein MVE64_11875 [Metabacillus endolithicus]
MKDNQLKQEELLQILLSAYDKGEAKVDITTNEMIEDLISQIRRSICIIKRTSAFEGARFCVGGA